MTGQEKTERATPRKVRKAREDGNVARSQTVNSAAVMIAGIAAAAVFGDDVIRGVRTAATHTFAAAVEPDANAWTLVQIARDAFGEALAPLLLPAAALVAITGLVAFVQVGPLLVLKPFVPKLDRLNPGKGLKNRIFSARAGMELAKSVTIMVVVSVVLWAIVASSLPTIVMLGRVGPLASATFAGRLVAKVVVWTVSIFLVVAAADFAFQKWQHAKDLRMTKEEVKREHKDQEGDPQAKAARQRAHQEILQYAMLQQVRKADVVIVNPDHIACALQYDPDEGDAPRLVASGRNYLAEKIKEIAREEGIPIARDVPLARAMIELEIDQPIPETLYEALGAVLRWVGQAARARGEVTPWDHLL